MGSDQHVERDHREWVREQELDYCVVADCYGTFPAIIYQCDTPEGRKQIPACSGHAELVGRSDSVVGRVEVGP